MTRKSRGLRFVFVGACVWLFLASIEMGACALGSLNAHESFWLYMLATFIDFGGWTAIVVALVTRLIFAVTSSTPRREKTAEVVAIVCAILSLLFIPLMILMYPPKG